MKKYFDDPLDAIHCFYAIIGSWDATSIVAINKDRNELSVIGLKHKDFSEAITMKPTAQQDFKNYIENRYIFTNEGSGLTVDYYFSRFDEVITRLKPEYAREHGIFFTDHNLSKFALWFVRHYYEKKLSDKYIVFDPAGGSGNLVTSWHGHLKHKIVSELEPDLLKTIERRMKLDDYHIGNFTVIPKTVENKGLNFLDISAVNYVEEIRNVLKEKNLQLDKPIAFLLNPPYKNTDENEQFLIEHDANYQIHHSILEITGTDAGRERYLAFLGQILNIAKYQNSINNKLKPLLMIFTPTSWLIPRPSFTKFRNEFDKYFKFEKGFIITSNDFFAVPGKWPLAFSIWCFDPDDERSNKIKLNNYTHLSKDDLNINWNDRLKIINNKCKKVIKPSSIVNFSLKRISIQKWFRQKMYDFKRNPTMTELDSIETYGGLPINDPRRSNRKTYGITNSEFIGFMDNCTPVRINRKKNDKRFSKLHEKRVWFRLDTAFININQTKIFNGPADNRSYCAYDLNSAKITFCWFAITKVLISKYPLWANQFNLWKPKIKNELEKEFYSLCFAFGLAENRCVVTKFEKDNPVIGAPEVFVDNPLSTNNVESFWNTTLDSYISKKSKESVELVSSIKKLYLVWSKEYCASENLYNIGLKDEPYFKFFDYDDFLTKDSGLIQIRKFAEINNNQDLLELFATISVKTRNIKNKIYELLVEDFKYFG